MAHDQYKTLSEEEELKKGMLQIDIKICLKKMRWKVLLMLKFMLLLMKILSWDQGSVASSKILVLYNVGLWDTWDTINPI